MNRITEYINPAKKYALTGNGITVSVNSIINTSLELVLLGIIIISILVNVISLTR